MPLPVFPDPPRPFAPTLPGADRIVGADDIETLLARLDPEPGVHLSSIAWTPAPLRIGEGWDNTIWDVGSLYDGTPLALRVARRASAVALLSREIVVLRLLAPRAAQLPMAIPAILATGHAAALHPWFPGRDASLGTAAELAWAGELLARTLAGLHTPAPGGLDRNPVRGVPLRERDEAFHLDLVRVGLPAELAARAREAWRAGLAAPDWTGGDLLLHGDPHPANVVLPDGAGPAALIDFGDTTPGDPAGDLGGLLEFGQAEPLLAAYRAAATWTGVDDDAVWGAAVARARGWAARYAVAKLTAYPADSPLGRVALGTLARL